MKRILSFLFLILIFSGCQRQPMNDMTSKEVSSVIMKSLDEEEFSEMDESYLGLTFEGMPDLQDASFYGRGNGREEIGILRAKTEADGRAAQASVQDYLEMQTSALSKQKELYPSEEAEAAESYFRNASVGRIGNYVYYFALDESNRQTALAKLQEILK